MKRKHIFGLTIAGVLVILGMLISILLQSYAPRFGDEVDPDIVALQDDIVYLMTENNRISEENQQLTDRIASLGAELSGENEALRNILLEIKQAEAFAGLTDVQGPGIYIHLNPETDAFVRSTTILAVVNELRASGALAVAVNDERIGAMTEIRDTGAVNRQVVINGNPYMANATFYILAVYQQEEIFRAMQLMDSILNQVDPSIATTLSERETITVPALEKDLLLDQYQLSEVP